MRDENENIFDFEELVHVEIFPLKQFSICYFVCSSLLFAPKFLPYSIAVIDFQCSACLTRLTYIQRLFYDALIICLHKRGKYEKHNISISTSVSSKRKDYFRRKSIQKQKVSCT